MRVKIFCDERQHTEKKEVNYNPVFEDLEVNFDNELDDPKSEKDTAAT